MTFSIFAMTAKAKTSSPDLLSDHIFLHFDNHDKGWWLALSLSFILHIVILLPASLPRTRPAFDSADLMKIKLVAPQESPKKTAKPVKKVSPPGFKRKIKTKINKKPKSLKKRKVTAKDSPLARRKSIPKKKPAPANNKLDSIKKRLARQEEEKKLDAIRQRLRQESSPAARARQLSLTQEYQNQLAAWLMRNWHLPEHLLNSGLEATICLTIDASGKLLLQNEEKLSSNPLFNHAMRQAVINASPFPPFPETLNIPQEEFVITFNPNNLKQ